jgi:basic membrane protein A
MSVSSPLSAATEEGIMRRTSTVLMILLALSVFAPLSAAAASDKKELKIGFVYISPVGSAGWSFSHDQARRKLAKDPGISTYTVENVPDGPDSENIIRDMSRRGYDIIVATSFDHMDSTLKVAEEFPNITYLHCSGYKTAPNVSAFSGRIYQPRYLSGIVAGSMTKTNSIGFVAAHPIPEVIRGINAFTIGVRAANPKAEVRVLWTNTWYDPFVEQAKAEELAANGVDVLAQHQDTTAVQEVAQQRRIWSVGYGSDMSVAAPDVHLVAPIWNWYPFYRDVVDQVRQGTWRSGNFWFGMDTGIVALSDFGNMVPQEVRERVNAREGEIMAGQERIFQGPILDQEGRERVAAGHSLSDEELLSMDWFVQGVVGTIE